MLTTKKAVDKHVADIFGKLKGEDERNLRSFSFAKLYFNVKEYELAKRYLAAFLSLKETPKLKPLKTQGHKLMGQIHEHLGQLEKAVQSYKQTLEMDESQKDVVLKLCELYCKIPVDPERARYWADRAERCFPHNEVVFRLRESLINVDGEQNTQELENLITNELVVRPKDVNLRIKLLKLYLDNERVKEAYEHATQVESKRPYYDSINWYYCLTDIFEAYLEENGHQYNETFCIQILNSFDRLVYLNISENQESNKENCSSSNQSRNMASTSALHSFDHHLYQASKIGINTDTWVAYLNHMKGQLYFHMAIIILKRLKMDYGSQKEASRFGAALLLAAYSFKTPNFSKWQHDLSGVDKSLHQLIYSQACYRLSQAGHVIIAMCREDKPKWLGIIREQVSTVQAKERLYQRVFNSKSQKIEATSSYFLHANLLAEMSEEFPEMKSLSDYDNVAVTLHPDNLHQIVWISLHQFNHKARNPPMYGSLVFKGLQYNYAKQEIPVPESLCLLDVEAFLYATVRCASLAIDDAHSYSYGSSDAPKFLPANISKQLCTEEQSEWWSAAFKMFTNAVPSDKMYDARRQLQHGIEVIRVHDNHGMDVNLVVYLARVFAEKAVELKAKRDDDISYANEVKHLEVRAGLYWKTALAMLDKVLKNEALRYPKVCLFPSYGRNPSFDETNSLVEEGNFFLSYQAMNEGRLEEAIAGFENLSSPYATYYQALSYKKLAADEYGSKPRESITSEMRSRHVILLTQARQGFYRTLDRIVNDQKHPLNQQLNDEIEDIETRLARIEPDAAILPDNNLSDESYDQESEEPDLGSPVQPYSNSMYSDIKCFTENASRPFTMSTPGFLRKRLNLSNRRQQEHVRPSPERLDAQIRSMTNLHEAFTQTIIEQNKGLMEANKAIVEELKEIKAVLSQLTKFSVVEELKQIKTVVAPLPSQLMELNRRIPLLAKNAKPKYGRKSQPVEPSAPVDQQQYDDNEDEGENEDYYDGYYYHEDGSDGEGSNTDKMTVHENLAYVYPDQQLKNDYRYDQNTGFTPATNYVYPPAQPGYSYFPPTHGLGGPPPQMAPNVGGNPIHGQAAQPLAGVVPPPQYYGSAPSSVFTGLPFSEGQKLPEFNFNVSNSQIGNLSGSPSAFGGVKVNDAATTNNFGDVIGSKFKFTPMKIGETSIGNGSPPVQPFNSSLTNSTANSSAFLSASSAPHAFQIQMPANSSLQLDSVEHKNELQANATTENVDGNAQFAEADSTSNRATLNRSESDNYYEEDATGPDFKPIIPLPAEIEVKTGEEDEKVLFEDRAKLYRFVEKEWKERGVGVVKILHNEESCKMRLLMRRDQIFKICANHYILSDMELKPMKNNEQTWIWAAKDFSEGQVVAEQFCIKFKTAEIGRLFKDKFDSARDLAKRTNGILYSMLTNEKPETFGDKFKPKPGSWACKECYVTNDSDKTTCIACGGRNPSAIEPPPVEAVNKQPQSFQFGFGDKFKPKPGNWTCSDCYVNNDAGKSNCVACNKPNPASTLTATSSTTNTGTTSTPSFKFGFSSTPTTSSADTGTAPSPSFKFGFSGTSTVGTVTPSAPVALNLSTSNFKFGFAPESTTPPSVAETSASTPGFVFGKSPQSKPSGFVFGASTLKADSENEKQTEDGEDFETEKTKSVFGNFSFGANQVVAKDLTVKFGTTSFGKTETPDLTSTTEERKSDQNVFHFGGFSFTTSPIVSKEPETKPIKIVTVEAKPVAKPNPFSGFSFTPSPVSNADKIIDYSKVEPVKVPDFCSKTSVSFSDIARDSPRTDAFKRNANFSGFDGAGATVFGGSPQNKSASEEFESTAQFQPVISLPELVNVVTGEEDEERLFGERAKLFRYNETTKEWKERGIGQLKIMKHKVTGRIRILMRREQILKVCANHCITENMKLQPMSSSEVAWIWVAKDFSEGELVEETLAAKFKTVDVAKSFREAFEKAQKLLSDVKPVDVVSTTADSTVKPLSEMFKPKPGSWKCNTCEVRNDEAHRECVACGTLNPTDKPCLGADLADIFKPCEGSWKCTVCLIQNSKDVISCVACATPKQGADSSVTSSTGTFKFGFTQSTPKKEEAPKFTSNVSTVNDAVIPPSSVFQFGMKTPVLQFGSSSPSAVEFQFGSSQAFQFNFGGVRPKSPIKTPKSPVVEDSLTEGEAEDETTVDSEGDSIYFHPVIPMPDKIEVRSGEEDEDVLYCHLAKLFRWSDGEWKERGVGDFKILSHRTKKKIRLFMRRKPILKICCNHYLTSDTTFTQKDDRSWMWVAQDFSDQELKQETLVLRFKTPEISKTFKSAIDDALKFISIQSSPIKKTVSFNLAEDSDTLKSDKTFGTTGAILQDSSKVTDADRSSLAQGDVELIEQKMPDETLRLKAESLKLPPAFYNYERSAPCPGCRGCDSNDDETLDKDEIAIVFEKKPSHEQIMKAKALMLPESFYLYETLPDCPGCRGCTDFIPVIEPVDENKATNQVPEKSELKQTIEQSKPISDNFPFSSVAANVLSFADLSRNNSTPFLASSNRNFKFAGAGASVFGHSNAKNDDDDGDEEDDHGDGNGNDSTVHDPQFQPIIPLPELVTVVTGEEDEDKLFGDRCKLYRFDSDGKQWKERGVGEMKLLKHKATGRCRLLMRREQVHKLVCNQAVTLNVEMKPFPTSESAWCWVGNDYSESEPRIQHFAVRFKTSAIANLFRSKYAQCQETLSNNCEN
ncbi:hypothetical protein CHUAL_002421 [Chamberlinius hualienensis]